ncbi:MAG: sulfite exporter TauE/SafE family protein [Candidatus Sericytochromatia bacterium]|nr:sulfite exporter TauE/SafE family protein [Candidatus Sericytochromatia bacterium]
MEFLGYGAAVLMGAVLGLIGGGGSILTVPILVYLFGIPPVLATAYSLFIVGLTSIFGILPYLRAGQVQVKTGILFSIPAMTGVFVARKFVVPVLPDKLLSLGTFILTKDMALMGLFAVMMVAASFSMIRSRPAAEPTTETDKKQTSALTKTLMIAVEGLVVGLLTGLVGAGGGFLVIPVLVIFAGLEMKAAVATSLLVISVKSLVGFLGDLGVQPMDWLFLGGFSVFTIVGALLGGWASKYVPSDKLKPAFGWFVLLMGMFILLNTGLSSGH